MNTSDADALANLERVVLEALEIMDEKISKTLAGIERKIDDAVARSSEGRGAAATSARAVERSSEVMRAMSDLMRANGVREDARELSREMARAGMMEEILEETLGETLDADGDEDETERAVEDVLREMVGEVEFPETAVGKAETETVVTETVVTETETETTTEDLKARLDAMRAE